VGSSALTAAHNLIKPLFDALFPAFGESAFCVGTFSVIIYIDSCKDDLEKGVMDVVNLMEFRSQESEKPGVYKP